jgi:hypothetical protein
MPVHGGATDLNERGGSNVPRVAALSRSNAAQFPRSGRQRHTCRRWHPKEDHPGAFNRCPLVAMKTGMPRRSDHVCSRGVERTCRSSGADSEVAPTSDITAPLPIETVDARVEAGVGAPRRRRRFASHNASGLPCRAPPPVALRDESLGSHHWLSLPGSSDAEMKAAIAGAGLGIWASICKKDRQIQMSPFQLFYILNLQ